MPRSIAAVMRASGVTHGLGFLVFVLGLLRRDRAAIAADLATRFRPFETPQGLRVPAVMNLFAARRP